MQPKERGNKRTNQQERGTVKGEYGAGKKSSKGKANGAKNIAASRAKKNLAKKAKTTAEKVCLPIL